LQLNASNTSSLRCTCSLFGVGLFATATSVIGLLWRIDLLSLLIAGLIAIAPVVFACRQFRFRSTVTPGMIAVLIPLLPVLAWAAFVPPYSWDELTGRR
jgi:hypothetical protein